MYETIGGERKDLGGGRQEELRERFGELWGVHEERVRRIIFVAGCDDPEGLGGEVARKCWQGFGVTVRRERKRVEEGWPGYNWGKWFGRAAERVVIDAKRRERTARRAMGMRARAQLDAERWSEAGAEAAEGEHGAPAIGPAPMDVDAVEDGSAENDPAVATEGRERRAALRRAVGALSGVEVQALMGWVYGERNWATAAALGLTWGELRQVQAAALERVRRRLLAEEWD